MWTTWRGLPLLPPNLQSRAIARWTWLAPFRCRTGNSWSERLGLLGRRVRVNSIPKGLLSFLLAIRRRVFGPGFSPDVVEVITADTRLDPQPAASELGIHLTGIDEMIKKSLG